MPNHQENQEPKRDLIVALHAAGSSPRKLRYVCDTVREAWQKRDKPEPIILAPALPVGMFSFVEPCELTKTIIAMIDRIWQAEGDCIGEIVLIGHSMGALLARKAYIYACGECDGVPLEYGKDCAEARPWASRVSRIVLIAAMNRGWSISSHLSLVNAVKWKLGILMGNILTAARLGRKRPLVFSVHRGAPFLTQLRLQWMAMRRRAGAESLGSAVTVQLLGSIDDIVSPQDNIDLVAGEDFFYLDVPQSGHVDVITADDTPVGRRRRRVIATAATASREQLDRLSILPSDHGLPKPDESVTDVVFVIHGIRDEGFWTQKIARRVVALARERNRQRDRGRAMAMLSQKRIVKTETSTYGYFAMLPFLLPNVRKRRVEWLMDRYAENKALYPKADFSYVGHSHGTYMLAKALETYPSVRFKNIAFAGSVVRTDYDWARLIRSGRVERVLNFVATADWVVAIFPRTFQVLRWQDLGSAGHDGFLEMDNSGGLFQSEFVRGCHSAALDEKNWRSIARFVLDGTQPQREALAMRRFWPIALAGRVAPILVLGGVCLVAFVGMNILGPVTGIWNQSGRVVAFALYVFFLWKVLTWL
ncbi:hypothetical protein AB4156_35205 [Cupriavidus sp. 2MCAB6]|uniref:hypothetical protein n=1 Tax=Cupriavidus sp. 2MCAB6 TaxID=3232981 RepID=UPI003F92B37F